MRSIICFPHTSSPGISRKSNRKMHFGELGLLFSRLFPMRFSEKATAKCILGNLGCFLARDKDVPQEKSNPNRCFREMRLPFHRNPGCFSEKRQPQKRISRKRVAFPSEHINAHMVSCRPKGRSAPLACCLPYAGGWKCGQGQATRWVVACRGASEPLDSAANRWHPHPKGAYEILERSTNTSLLCRSN